MHSIKLIFWLFITVAFGFHPVKDFRVKDLMRSTNQKVVVVKDDSDSDDSPIKLLPSATEVITTTSALSSSAPTIVINDDIQMVYTDNSKSIYYLTSHIIDTITNYNETFQLLLDTGSSVSWVYNQSCSSNACQQTTINKFDDFSRSLNVSSTFSLTYSGETVNGDLINGLNNKINFDFDGFTISNLTIGLASTVPDLFNGFNVSGILGIPSNNDENVDRNLIYQLNSLGIIDKQIFGLSLVASSQTIRYIDQDSNPLTLPSNYGGLMIFGSKALDYKDKFVSDSSIYYADLIPNQDDYWLINLQEIETKNSTAQTNFSTNESTIIDTGTTGFVLPQSDSDLLHQQLFGSSLITDNNGNYAFPCNSTDQQILFTINGHGFEINVDDFKGKEYTTNGLQGYCASMIQGLDTTYWVFGAAFLSKFYTVFDLEQGQIGFGDSRITSYTLESPTSLNSGTSSHAFAYSNSTTTSISSTSSSSTSSSSSLSSSSTKTSSNSSSVDNHGEALTFSNLAFIASLISCII